MSEWKETKLKDAGCKILSGYAFKSEDYSNTGIPLIKIGNIQNKVVSIDDNGTFIKADLITEKLSKYLLCNEDILISMTGQGSVGRVGKLQLADKQKALLNQRVGKFITTNSEVNIKYLYYVISSPTYQEYLFNTGSGSGQPNLSPELILETEIILPPLPEQELIAEVLSSLDDKIDLLHRNNKTLEQLAETLFRQWFVEDTSASEITIGEITKITSGKSLNRSHFLEKGTYPIYGSNGIIGWTNNYTFDENLIITGRVGTLGTVKIIDEKCWISDNVLIIKPNSELYKYPIYFSMKGYDFESLNVGSTQPLLTQGELNKQLVVILDEYKLLSCKMYFDELFNKIKQNLTQIQKLETLRDTLLPKFMSGVVRVEN